jgi:cytochrome c oxidase cbb3-type subunit 3
MRLVLVLLLAAGCEREVRDLRTPAAQVPTVATVRAHRLTPGPDSAFVPGKSAEERATIAHGEQNAYFVSQGKQLFAQYNCGGCHANGGGGMGPALIDDHWLYGAVPDSVYRTITAGRPNGMPAFGPRLAQADAWKLVAYVRSMSGLVAQDVAPARNDAMQSKPAENTINPPTRVVVAPPPPAATAPHAGTP